MIVGQINKTTTLLPFKGNSKDNENNNSSLPFIAGSAVLGGGIGALTPEKIFLQDSSEITKDNLKNLLETSSQHKSLISRSQLKKYRGAIRSALTELNKFVAEKTGLQATSSAPAKPAEDASMFASERFMQLQESNFEKIKKYAPVEPRWQGATKGAVLGGSIALGLTVMSKLLSESKPPEDISTDYWESPLMSLSIKQ